MRCKHEWVRVSSRWDGVTPFKPLPGDSVCCCRCGKPKVKGPPLVESEVEHKVTWGEIRHKWDLPTTEEMENNTPKTKAALKRWYAGLGR